MESVANKMERCSQEYFELYNKCANRIEGDTKGSVEALVVGSLGAASNSLGRFIESTPLGDASLIDEVLIDGSKKLDSIIQGGADKHTKTLALAKPGFMRPFIDSVKQMDRLHNEPVAIAANQDSIYVLQLG